MPTDSGAGSSRLIHLLGRFRAVHGAFGGLRARRFGGGPLRLFSPLEVGPEGRRKALLAVGSLLRHAVRGLFPFDPGLAIAAVLSGAWPEGHHDGRSSVVVAQPLGKG